MKKCIYEIYLNNKLISKEDNELKAVLRYNSLKLIGYNHVELIKFYSYNDPVLGDRFIYDAEIGGWEWIK